MGKYTRKTEDVWEIQGNYFHGCGYEVLTTETTRKDAKQILKDYRENDKNGIFRIVKKRIKIWE